MNLDQSLLPTPSTSTEGSSTNFGFDNNYGSANLGSNHNGSGSPFDLGGFDSELISDFYTFFHPAHPCVLPRWSLEKHWALSPEEFSPVLHMMQYIGSLFNELAPSESYKALAKTTLPLHRKEFTTPYEIQAMILFSIATYWSDEVEYGLEIAEDIIPSAIGLQMHHDGCATQYGKGDPVLEESWRRTWWQLYQTHAHMAASAHAIPTALSGLYMSVRLPSEEDAYESGVSDLLADRMFLRRSDKNTGHSPASNFGRV